MPLSFERRQFLKAASTTAAAFKCIGDCDKMAVSPAKNWGAHR